MEEKKKRGRPFGFKVNEPKSKQKMVRFTDEQEARLKADAQNEQRTESAIILRRYLLGEAIEREKPQN